MIRRGSETGSRGYRNVCSTLACVAAFIGLISLAPAFPAAVPFLMGMELDALIRGRRVGHLIKFGTNINMEETRPGIRHKS